MQNYFAIETEAAHQRREWARAVEADARAARASPRHGLTRWRQLPRRVLARLPALAPSRVRLASAWDNAAERRIMPNRWKEDVAW